MRALNESLEQQAADRTAELAAANAELRAEMRRQRAFSVLVQGVADNSLMLLRTSGLVATWKPDSLRLMNDA